MKLNLYYPSYSTSYLKVKRSLRVNVLDVVELTEIGGSKKFDSSLVRQACARCVCPAGIRWQWRRRRRQQHYQAHRSRGASARRGTLDMACVDSARPPIVCVCLCVQLHSIRYSLPLLPLQLWPVLPARQIKTLGLLSSRELWQRAANVVRPLGHSTSRSRIVRQGREI